MHSKVDGLIGLRRVLFFLISITFILYMYRNVVALNVEFIFVFIFLVSIFVFLKVKKAWVIPKPIMLWVVLLFFYWISTIVATYAHPDPNSRALGVLNVASLSVFFVILTIALYKLKAGLNFFWYLMLMGGVVALSLGILDAYQYGWFSSGVDGSRLGNLNSNAVKFAVIVNCFFVILLGSFPWAYKKNKTFLLVVVAVVLGLLLLAILTKSRTAWIGWPEALIIWGTFYFYHLKTRFPKVKYLKSIVFTAFAILIFILIQIDMLKKPLIERGSQTVQNLEKYFSGESMKSSIGYRLLGYEVAMNKIPEVFWFGIGEDAFPEFLKLESKKLALERFNQEIPGFTFSQLHNQFLMSFLTKGVVVFLSVLLFFLFLIIFFARSIKLVSNDHKPVAVAGLVFSIVSFLSFMPETPLQNTDMATNFFLLASLLIVFTVNGFSGSSKSSIEVVKRND